MKPFDIIIIQAHLKINPMALIIYERTSTWWTHCVLVKNDNGDIWNPNVGGILDDNISRCKGRKICVLRYKHSFDEKPMYDWVLSKQKTCEGYDYIALLGFLTGVKYFEDEERWYCAELPMWCFWDNGHKLSNEEMTFVYPSFFIQNTNFDIISEGIL